HVRLRRKAATEVAAGPQGMLDCLESRQGVEAYVEPKTVMHPLSAVLVAGDGEHKRFELSDDSYLRELIGTHNLKVFDAARLGYPTRMREYLRRPPGSASDSVS